MNYVICLNNDGSEDKFDIGKIYKYEGLVLSNWAGGIPENDAIIIDNFSEKNVFIKPFFNGKFRLIDLSELRSAFIDKILNFESNG